MPPIKRTDEPLRVNHHPLHRNEAGNKHQPTAKRFVENGASRKGEFRAQAQQRREQLERLIPATAGFGIMNDVRLHRVTVSADNVQREVHQKAYQEFQRVQPDISARALKFAAASERDRYNMDDYRKAVAEYRKDTGYTGPTDMVEVSQHADKAYREVLEKAGFRASDVDGDSAAKAADFMTKRADDGKPFSVLAESEVKSRVARNEPTGDYFARLVERVHMTGRVGNNEPTLTNSEKAWMALTDESAGAKLTARGLMKHVGLDGATIDNPKTKASDWVLMITRREGQADVEVPTWESRIDEAKGHKNFKEFQKLPETEQLFQDVRTYSELEIKSGKTMSAYKPDVTEFWAESSAAKKKGINLDAEAFAQQKIAAGEMTPHQADVFRARNQMQNTFGMSENFGGEGWAVSPDGQVTGREMVVKNGKVADQPQHIFLELRDGKFPSAAEVDKAVREGKQSPLEIVRNTRNVEANPLRLGNEMKGGAKTGAAFSAASSLYEIFSQPGAVDYKSAATTVAVNTASGSTVGAISAGGERIVGRGIENALSRSNLASQGLERLYTNGAARNVVSRLAQTETSAITSQTFSATVRTIAGRVGGAGIIGGVVNGAFSSYDQIGAYRRGEVRGAQAFGTIVGETAVGVGAGAAGAAAGAAVGVWFGGVGAVPGAIIGFGVGLAADKVMRMGGVDKAIAKGVTATIDAGSRAAGAVRKNAGQAVQAGRQFVGQQVRQARAVYHSASSAVRSARTFVAQRVNQARAAISSGTRAAVNYVSQAGSRAISAVRNTASQAVNQVRSTVNNVANQVSSTVSNFANQARSTVTNAVNNMAGGAVSSLRSVFGW